MLVKVCGAKCVGIDAVRVTVEVNVELGIGLFLVGMADVAVKESILRTTTALTSLGYRIPGKKIIINLAPAELRKNGGGYDLPIGLGIIAATAQKNLPCIGDYLVMGELALDGSVRSVPGALPFADLARKEGFKGIIMPVESALEAVEMQDIKVYGINTLQEAVRILEGEDPCEDLLCTSSRMYRKARREHMHSPRKEAEVDFADIIGQEGAKRGVEIACGGGHNLIMIGSPGSGKSSLAKAIPGILPPMTMEEAMITSKIYSVAGKKTPGYGFIRTRPFRSPHYSASLPAMIGGGSGGDGVLPGEVSLSCGGVLFLDEVGQIPKSVLEALRAPMEDRVVSISRLKSKIEYPASFMLVAASNPCPCGYWGEGDRCTCSPYQRRSYLQKLSGPIMDRLDLQVWLRAVPTEMMMKAPKGESSSAVAQRVLEARIRQKQRFAREAISCNAEMNNRMIEKYCPLSGACLETLKKIIENMQLSMRAYFRIIKVARTIADLAGEEDIRPQHLLEAASFRFLDKKAW